MTKMARIICHLHHLHEFGEFQAERPFVRKAIYNSIFKELGLFFLLTAWDTVTASTQCTGNRKNQCVKMRPKENTQNLEFFCGSNWKL